MNHLKETPFLEIDTLIPRIQQEHRPDGTIILRSLESLQAHPDKITERLKYWAAHQPHKVFLGQKNASGQWQLITYAEALQKVESLAQYLLACNLSGEKPIAILSGNSLEHGLLALAAMHIGIPYAPISPSYSTKSKDFNRLGHCLDLLEPGLIFVQNRKTYESAIQAVAPRIPVMTVEDAGSSDMLFEEALKTPVTAQVAQAYQAITPHTIAKILFTSGSTGHPKGVINTHGNMTTNWQQITQTFRLMADGGLNLIDWLPWNHTFGGNHNFGLTLYNGGSLYIDEGNPTPKGIAKTVQNLREIAPTVYFNVPKGFEELIPYLENDQELCRHFFSQLKMFFYAGASLSQYVWDKLEQLAYETTGKRLLIASGLGMTEASPSAMFNTRLGSIAGELGVPVPGLEVKLVPNEDKMEARFKGANITPGYWRNEEATRNAFDEEGYYKTGDALLFIDPQNPNRGMLFNGRISEDFKLNTGTWVSVGTLRTQLIAAGKGLILDAVITGLDRAYVGAIVFPDLSFAQKLLNTPDPASPNMMKHPKMRAALQEIIDRLAGTSTGSSTTIYKAIFADFELSIDQGEITDKGSINQRAVLKHRSHVVERLYEEKTDPDVIVYNPSKVLQ